MIEADCARPTDEEGAGASSENGDIPKFKCRESDRSHGDSDR